MITFSPPVAVRARAVLLLVSLSFVPSLSGGCSDQGPQDDLLLHLEAARTRWNATRPDRYTYDLRRSCECTPEMTGPVSVLVEGVAPVGWSYLDGSPVPEELRSSFPSVDGLLDLIEAAIRQEAWEVNVQYDVETGVPVQIRIDYDQFVFDEEATYRVVAMPTTSGA